LKTSEATDHECLMTENCRL